MFVSMEIEGFIIYRCGFNDRFNEYQEKNQLLISFYLF